MSEKKYTCYHCKKNEIEGPKYCCDGRECACFGRPLYPPLCKICLDVVSKDNKLMKMYYCEVENGWTLGN